MILAQGRLLAGRGRWGRNLVANPSVEQGGAEPDGWFHTPTGTEWSEPGHSGAKALRITVADDTADWRCTLYPVAGGTTYRCGLWVAGQGGPHLIVAVRWFRDAAGLDWITETWIPLPDAYPTWTWVEQQVDAPADAVAGDLMFRCAFPTTVDVRADDFLVRERRP